MTTQLSDQQTTTARIASDMIEKGLIVATDDHTLHTYDESLGRYVPAEVPIRADLIQLLGDSWTPSRADTVLRWLSDFAPRLWDSPPLDRVNVRNGILDLQTEELAPHSKDFLSPVQIDAEWHPGAECPRIDRFVAEVFPSDSEQLFFELAGLYITPDTRQQMAVILNGNGSNGKSATIEVLTRLLGRRNVSNVSLHELCARGASTAQLYGKLLNTFTDIPDTAIMDTSNFLKLVDGRRSAISVDRKYRGPFTFRPFARLLFSANRALRSPDTSHSHLRRWLAIPYSNSFRGKEDRFLIDKLTTPQEISGLLTRAVRALGDMTRRGCLAIDHNLAVAQGDFRMNLDSVREFVNAETDIDPDVQVDQADLYRAYREWCAEMFLEPVGPHKFNASVTEVDGIIRFRSNGRRRFAGIGLIPEPEPKLLTPYRPIDWSTGLPIDISGSSE